MYDAGCPSEQRLQRASGTLRIAMRLREGRTVLHRLRQEGCLKARFPRPERDAWTTAVLLNVSGGVAGGDRLSSDIRVGAGASATFAAQAAERYYRTPPPACPARVHTTVTIEDNARAEWLPQETILFDGCSLHRKLDVQLAASASFLGVESLIFGRARMGERVRRGAVSDTLHVERDGRPLLHDAIRIKGEIDRIMARAAVADGGRALAIMVHAAPDAEARLLPARAALAGAPAEWGASAWDGMVAIRLLAADAACLRAAVVAGLSAMRDSRPLPRVWMC